MKIMEITPFVPLTLRGRVKKEFGFAQNDRSQAKFFGI